MDAFNSNVEEVLQRKIDIAEDGKRFDDVNSYLELDKCKSFVTEHDFKRASVISVFCFVAIIFSSSLVIN